MDEAEFLSQRIAILDSGKVRALGSPAFLKSAFGCGYNLKLTVPRELNTDALSYVEAYFGCRLAVSSETSHQLQLQIPSRFKPLFGGFLSDMDRDMENLGIEGFSIA
jgi:ABC-type multidrug transport system ATPase subunit